MKPFITCSDVYVEDKNWSEFSSICFCNIANGIMNVCNCVDEKYPFTYKLNSQ